MSANDEEQHKLYCSILPEEIEKMKAWRYNEIEPYFVCSTITKYKELMKLPRDFTIIDLGCNQACQSAYYEDFGGYIGVDVLVPIENRLQRKNAIHYQMDYKVFLNDILPQLLSKRIIDLDKTVAVSYLMPGVDYDIIKENFKYFDIYYPGYDKNSRNLPEPIFEKKVIH